MFIDLIPYAIRTEDKFREDFQKDLEPFIPINPVVSSGTCIPISYHLYDILHNSFVLFSFRQAIEIGQGGRCQPVKIGKTSSDSSSSSTKLAPMSIAMPSPWISILFTDRGIAKKIPESKNLNQCCAGRFLENWIMEPLDICLMRIV